MDLPQQLTVGCTRLAVALSVLLSVTTPGSDFAEKEVARMDSTARNASSSASINEYSADDREIEPRTLRAASSIGIATAAAMGIVGTSLIAHLSEEGNKSDRPNRTAGSVATVEVDRNAPERVTTKTTMRSSAVRTTTTASLTTTASSTTTATAPSSSSAVSVTGPM